MDHHLVSVFAVQSFVTTLVLTFCIGMLARGADPGVYLPVLTGITGFWFPSPLQQTSVRPLVPTRESSFNASPEIQIVSDPEAVAT